ncbi:hypothetical protein D3C80_1080280 [compost metagenome]
MKNITSEKMNHDIPQRKERSSCGLYSPARLSLTTAPNQPKSMYAKHSAPKKKIHGPWESGRPALRSLNQVPKPNTVMNMPIVAMIGHLLCAGT